VRVRFCLDWGARFTWPYHSFYDDRLAEPPATPGNRAVAENIRYFAEQQAESVYIQFGGSDRPSEAAQMFLQMRDQRSHVAVWSASDDVLPDGDQWAVQFAFRLTGIFLPGRVNAPRWRS
jgi:hypothetical protein